jgi:hypothetical protein
MAAPASHHPVWKAVGLVVAGYIVLRLILVHLQQQSAASAGPYRYFIGGGGGSGYTVGSGSSASGKKTTTPALPPATGLPIAPPTSPGLGWQRFGYIPPTNPYLFYGPKPKGGPVELYGGGLS